MNSQLTQETPYAGRVSRSDSGPANSKSLTENAKRPRKWRVSTAYFRQCPVSKIKSKVNPAAIILVGHSRGGLAARAYLQSLSIQPPFRLGLLTIGTLHQGTPFGRIPHWMRDNQYTTYLLLKEFSILNPIRFVFSPSTFYFATDHDTGKNPIQTAISAEIWKLNDQVGRLGSFVSTFGQIVSTGLRLGEKVDTPIGYINLLDGASAYLFRLLPGDFDEMKNFALKNLPDDWKNDGDGIVPANSQRLSELPGFTRASEVFNLRLIEISHTDETSQTAAIRIVLDKMAEKLRGDSVNIANNDQESATNGRLIEEFENELKEAANKLSTYSSDQVLSSMIQGMRSGDDFVFNAAKKEIIARARESDPELVNIIESQLSSSAPRERVQLISLFGHIASEPALNALLRIASKSEGTGSQDRAAALAEIANIGRHIDQEQDAESLTKLLEGTFSATQSVDSELLEAVATGLSTLGTQPGVETLLDFIKNQESISEVSLRITDVLRHLRNPAAVEPLALLLQRDPSLSQHLTKVAGDALAGMGTPEATKAILQWAVTIKGEHEVEQALVWLSQVKDSRSVDLLRNFLNSRTFQDPQMQNGLKETVKAISRQLTPTLPGVH